MPTVERVAIALDLFPATAYYAGTSIANVRAVVADGTLQLYRLGGLGPEVYYEQPVVGALGGSVHTGVVVPVPNGEVWIERGDDCGCGSALKVADLFPGRQKVMTGLR